MPFWRSRSWWKREVITRWGPLPNEVSAPSPSKMNGHTTGLPTMFMDSRLIRLMNLMVDSVHEVAATQKPKITNKILIKAPLLISSLIKAPPPLLMSPNSSIHRLMVLRSLHFLRMRLICSHNFNLVFPLPTKICFLHQNYALGKYHRLSLLWNKNR